MNDPYVRLEQMKEARRRKLGYWDNTLRRVMKINTDGDEELEAVRQLWEDAVKQRITLIQKQFARLVDLRPKLEAAERRSFQATASGTPTKNTLQIVLKKGGKSYTRHLRYQNGAWYGKGLRSEAIVRWEV